ncbi:hypothetical protein AYK21_05100 [Thermoplasmatales archaeon SG8-52-2]|nr:MAG: hypothetical protein AYK21_05100 [Thermoplasmatales archaeon SG8-52-2]
MLKMKHYITIITKLGEKMRRIYYFKNVKHSIILVVFLMISVSFAGLTCSADGIADTYAPIFYFEGEETCYPIDAQYHLDNSIEKWVDELLPGTYFYDNTHGTIKDEGVINHYKSVMDSYGYTVYYRTYEDFATSSTVIQYWIFYAFNKGELNQHEGDWELVQVVVDDFDGPVWVAYSQHHSGQRASWSQVEKEGNHIKVYVARGSHANYLRSYSGKLGIASDIVGANGKVLNYNEYTLESLDNQIWIDFEGRWGEVADNEADAIEASILGQAGPPGPKYREEGNMWDDPIYWGTSVFESNDMLFTLEWVVYNFVLIFIVISLIIIALLVFRIYRNHKKYGLGPRIVSMLYINGPNLHSIGNILCIAGIVIAILGLFNPWYTISYGVSGEGITDTFKTSGMVDLFKFDGLNGIRMTIPGTSGPTPMGSFVLPFSLFIAIGLIFLIIATIGIPFSRKLGTKYIWRGVRLIIPFILIIIVIMALASIVTSAIPAELSAGAEYVEDILGSISSGPLGGQSTTVISLEGGLIDGQVDIEWGLGSGGWLLLTAGIILIIAGVLELMSKTQFFTTKVPLGTKLPKGAQMPPTPTVAKPKETKKPPKEKSKKDKTKEKFCTECGDKLEDNATFCVKCGKKVE